MRFVILGAGAVGSLFAAHLSRAGEAVVLVSRPAHCRAIGERGLFVVERDGTAWCTLPHAVETIRAAEPGLDDLVVLTCKAYDTAAAVEGLARAARGGIRAVVCLQNGVANEAIAAKSFPDVYAVMARFSARLLEPGKVLAAGNRYLEFGRHPAGIDPLVEDLVMRVRRAGIEADAAQAVMAAKWSKLVMNCANAIYAICDVPVSAARSDPAVAHLINAVWAEAEDVLKAAAVAHEPVPPLPIPALAADVPAPSSSIPAGEVSPTVETPPYYGSSWDDLVRRSGKSEAPWLNGQIVRLAEQLNVSAPTNTFLLRTALDMAERREPPGCHTPEELLTRLSDVSPSTGSPER